MKKYIVRVAIVGIPHIINKCDMIYTVKAKNCFELERLMKKELYSIINFIAGYEYEEVKPDMFKKNNTTLMVGSWVGVEMIK